MDSTTPYPTASQARSADDHIAETNDRASPTPTSLVRPHTEELDEYEVSLASPIAPSPSLLDEDDSLMLVEPDCYRREHEIARGGLGKVSTAYDQRLGREVAIKEMLHPHSVQQGRFMREALITAKLQHPSIVPVYEAGYWPNGTPFYAMKNVAGRTLSDLLHEAETLPERLAYLANVTAVADAVAYAHTQRVIHRDLKPSNVILGDFGETVLVDWGLAKELDTTTDGAQTHNSHENDAFSTQTGSIVGTPTYMPPEQAHTAEVDERADIYSLGALLYHVLSGHPPYAGSTANDILAQLRTSPPAPLAQRVPEAPKELVTIVEQAMARDVDERYQSARDVVADLKRFQNGQLVSVHQYTTWALVKRWVHRYRALVVLAAIMLTLLAVTALISVWRIVEERNVTRERSDQLTVAQAAKESDPTAASAWLKTLRRDASNWPHAWSVALGARNRGVARHVWREHTGLLATLARSPDGRFLAWAGADRTIRIRNLDTARTTHLGARERHHDDSISDLQLSPSGDRLASVGFEGTVRVWNLDGELLQTFPSLAGYRERIRFSPRGTHIAEMSSFSNVRVHDLSDGTSRDFVGHASQVTAVAFSPDGAWLASSDLEGAVHLWNVEAPESVVRLRAHEGMVRSLDISTDGARMASSGDDGDISIRSLPDGRETARYEHGEEVYFVGFSPSGSALVSTTHSGNVWLWDHHGNKGLLGVHQGRALGAAFSPDGTLVASWGADGIVRVWNTRTRHCVHTLAGHGERVRKVVWSQDGSTLWSYGNSNGIREWDLTIVREQRVRGPVGSVKSIALTGDARFIAAGFRYGGILLWDREGRVKVIAELEHNIEWLEFSPDDTRLFAGTWSGDVWAYDLRSGNGRIWGKHQGQVLRLAVSPTGHQVATSGEDGKIALWEPESGQARWLDVPGRVESVAYSTDGHYLASASDDGGVRLWNASPDVGPVGEYRVLGRHEGGASVVAFSPTGLHLISGGRDYLLRQWNLETGASRILEGHEQRRPLKIRFSSDGTRFVTTAWESRYGMLWDLENDTYRREPLPTVVEATFTPDGQSVFLLCLDSTLRVWNTETGEIHVLTKLGLIGYDVEVSRDGRVLVFGDGKQTLYLWQLDVPREIDGLRSWLHEATTAEISTERPLATMESSPR